MTVELRRHDRVWLAASGGDARGSRAAAAFADPRLANWIARGRALVVRRRDGDVAADEVPLAVALPRAEGRARIALVVERRAIVRSAPPLGLADVIDTAPHSHRPALADLVDRGAAVGTSFRVYGSFAWQSISGEACVTPTSDLDLLWDAFDRTQVLRTITVLEAWQRATGLRADGEARFPDGGAVAWRELTTSSARVLVKRDDGVSMAPTPLPGFPGNGP